MHTIYRHTGQRGSALIELALALPVMLTLGLGVVQMSLLYQARTIVNYATFEAARKGALLHAQKEPMMTELGLRLAPLQGGDASMASAARALSHSVTDVLSGGFTELTLLSPSVEVFADWGLENREEGKLEIPNSHLAQRDQQTGARSGVNIQDANLLKIKVTHGVELKVPFVGPIITSALSRVMPQYAHYYRAGRVPVTSIATVRMQSPAWRSDDNPSVGAASATPLQGAAVVAEQVAVAEVACDEYGFRMDLDPQDYEALMQSNAGADDCGSDFNPLDKLLGAPTGALPGMSHDARGSLTDCQSAK